MNKCEDCGRETDGIFCDDCIADAMATLDEELPKAWERDQAHNNASEFYSPGFFSRFI